MIQLASKDQIVSDAELGSMNWVAELGSQGEKVSHHVCAEKVDEWVPQIFW